ncbi:hypothetical protein, partial [Teredinibacter waterburyi]|uniref:hypothetical protein n=1 Tax=Teredinibacter waterburyi TaxID=1500538 RepID=UPI001CAA8518
TVNNTNEFQALLYQPLRRITPQTAADLLLVFLCENGEAMHKKSDGKAVQGAQRLMLFCFVKCFIWHNYSLIY